ncbi:MAG: PorT family protein [Bacteroidales bacterium]|jgi:hypothetical protein|nr:PorT family protein [Bacteroidales bacterium]
MIIDDFFPIFLVDSSNIPDFIPTMTGSGLKKDSIATNKNNSFAFQEYELLQVLNKYTIYYMRKIIIITLTLIAIKTYGQNHYLGVDAGLHFAGMASKDFKPSFKTAFAGGLTYEYFFSKHISVGAGAVYSMSGFSTKNPIDSAGRKSKTNFDYLTIPLKFGFVLGDKFFGFVKVGLIPAILIQAKEVVPQYNNGEFIENETTYLTNKVRKMDIGGVIELGGGYNVSERCKIKLSLAYHHSFSSVTTDNYYSKTTMRNRGINLSLGLSWALSSKPLEDEYE